MAERFGVVYFADTSSFCGQSAHHQLPGFLTPLACLEQRLLGHVGCAAARMHAPIRAQYGNSDLQKRRGWWSPTKILLKYGGKTLASIFWVATIRPKDRRLTGSFSIWSSKFREYSVSPTHCSHNSAKCSLFHYIIFGSHILHHLPHWHFFYSIHFFLW
jgi:hypothetical protein